MCVFFALSWKPNQLCHQTAMTRGFSATDIEMICNYKSRSRLETFSPSPRTSIGPPLISLTVTVFVDVKRKAALSKKKLWQTPGEGSGAGIS